MTIIFLTFTKNLKGEINALKAWGLGWSKRSDKLKHLLHHNQRLPCVRGRNYQPLRTGPDDGKDDFVEKRQGHCTLTDRWS